MRQPADVLKHLAEEAAQIGRFDCAAYYARRGLGAGGTLGAAGGGGHPGWVGVAALFTARHGSALAKSSRMIPPLEPRLIRYQPGQFSDRRRNILINAPELAGAPLDRVGVTA